MRKSALSAVNVCAFALRVLLKRDREEREKVDGFALVEPSAFLSFQPLRIIVLICFFNFGKTIESSADKIALFSGSDFSGHTVTDFISADHQHATSPQLLAGNTVEIPFFVGIFHLKVLGVRKFRANRDVSQLVHFPAVSLKQAGRSFFRSTDICKGFFHDFLPFHWTPKWASGYYLG